MSSFLDLVVVALKLVYSIINSIISWKVEERDRFEKRMRNITNLLKDAIDNKDEAINEKDYLSNLEWEKQERYKKYKLLSYTSLSAGGGIHELSYIKDMSMGLRVLDRKESIIGILLKNLSIEEKSKWIAKTLST